MQQRYRRAIRVTLISLGAALSLSGIQLASAHMPSTVALAAQMVLTAAVAALWVRWQRAEWERALPRRANAWRAVALSVVICVAVASAYHMAVEPSGVKSLQRVADDIPAQAVLVLTATVTGPLLNEALFRGYLLGRLRRSFGSTTSVLLSGIVFALASGDPSRVLPDLVTGVVLGILVVRTGRLWLAVVAHALTNAIGLIEHVALSTGIPGRLGIAFPLLCFVVAMVAALALHYVLTSTRWSIPVSPTARVARPLTWGIDATG